uniref:Protein p26 n=1 Tax=Lymantria dispar multicapsid nuclear polyhedrosis virus TaxID=10449 RepID=A0A1B1MQS2_NPVLD|nr:protein p26 [Lymantria dispar multiple nucleopolyhedrovirus]
MKSMMSFLLLLSLLSLCGFAAAGADDHNVPVNYAVDKDSRTIFVNFVNNRRVDIRVISPFERLSASMIAAAATTTTASQQNYYYPGVMSDVSFSPMVGIDDELQILLANGTLFRTTIASDEFVSYHVHARRIVLGRVPVFAVHDFALAEQIWSGAPVFKKKDGGGLDFTSVVSRRFDDYANDRVLFPVVGANDAIAVSVDRDFVEVRALAPAHSVYGTRAFPDAESRKRFEASVADGRSFRDWPRVGTLFHDAASPRTVFTLTEGDFEILNVQLPGVLLLTSQT